MDQQKIGEFIAKLRKEKGLTQQELAKKIGVTDKAISKWENGRCLMDIAILKPLSEQLDISILELMNGEKIEKEDIILRTNEIVESTLDYTENKIKKLVKRIIKIMAIVILFIVLFIGYIYFKLFAAESLFQYNYHEGFGVTGDLLLNENLFENEIIVEKKEINEDEYWILDKMSNEHSEHSEKNNLILKIKKDSQIDLEYNSDFNDYSGGIISDSSLCNFDIFICKIKPVIKSILFYIDIPYTEYFKKSPSSTISLSGVYNKHSENFLLKNNIKNDLDLFKWIHDNHTYSSENSIFDSISTMSKRYRVDSFLTEYFELEYEKYKKPTKYYKEEPIDSGLVKGMTLISGDYTGYIFNFENYDYFSNKAFVRKIHILKNNLVYVIELYGEEYTDEYIQELLSTLVIE